MDLRIAIKQSSDPLELSHQSPIAIQPSPGPPPPVVADR
jgi:hypothetical protein